METDLNLVRVELIDDPATIAEMEFDAHCRGANLVCRRCGNINRPIAAILVVPAGGYARLPLCADCLRVMPK